MSTTYFILIGLKGAAFGMKSMYIYLMAAN